MKAPEEIIKLLERFEDNIDAYKSGKYNEAQVRQEFINPFFKALGWDVQNEQGWAEAYKDVVHEDAIKISGATKAPDYCFRIGGTRKFFLEAKKPSIDIKNDIHPAFQLRRYAWSAKLPLSILTDFEEFAVYDCRVKPVKTDKASTARILYFNYKDYADKWDEINSIFSREAILKGSFDRYVESGKKKRGTAEVDSAFLKEIESWRENLAKNIAIRNPELTQRPINFSVQKIIDRIIFLRISEDRGLESEGALREIGTKSDVYGSLRELFIKADKRYNSGLFHFKKEKDISGHPDELTLTLKLDDAPLKAIIKNLYYPDSPYEFSVLPPDILGHVYEQFLGKVIRLTPSHRAIIEEKPEVRKAGGVYYTPTYIVDYIVKNTVGKLLEDKTPAQASKLKILDPACGSGSFLIGAYQYLLDWHLKKYQEHFKRKRTVPQVSVENRGQSKSRKKHPVIYQGSGGGWRLTLYEKKRILLNNIYGVDIDDQAVEVTKLSLLLKLLEGESQMHLFHERILPNLGKNIKCGNSLIGPDFYENQPMDLFDEKERYHINVFDWKSEFPEILDGSNPGFDAVIGNPPYIRIQTLQEFQPVSTEFIKRKYISASSGSIDIYAIFLEKSFQLLNKSGISGYILPHKFFQADFGKNIREIISDKKAITKIINFGANQIFENALTYTCLFFMTRKSQNYFLYKYYQPEKDISQSIEQIKFSEIPVSELEKNKWAFHDKETSQILSKLDNMPIKLGDITRKIFQGLATSADKIYVLRKTDSTREDDKIIKLFSQSLNREVEIERDFVKPFLMGKNVKRYAEPVNKSYVVFPYIIEGSKPELMSRKYIMNICPLAWQYLTENKTGLEERERGKMKGDNFYAYIYPKNLKEFEAVKISTPEIANSCQMTIDTQGNLYHTTKVYSFIFQKERQENQLYFLGILNSKLLWFFLKSTGYILQGGYFTFKTQYLKPFPICEIDFNNSEDKDQHDKMVELVAQMLKLKKQLAETNTSHDKTAIQRQIDVADHQIDQLVYKLYDLTENEIKTVEEIND